MHLFQFLKRPIAKTPLAGCILALVAIGTVGCGPSTPPTALVSGVVKCDGKPVVHAMVTFFPQGVTDAKIGFGQTDAEGKFTTVSTFGNGDGVVVGHHKVAITEAWPPDLKEVPKDNTGMEKSPPRGPWVAKYRDSSSGALQVDVGAKEKNFFEFELTSK